ncbi:MAG: hypothetical protein J3K34DRAFT_477956 [Monoraphidium minutum]|nr:MAG: hypothetical protein J3K34DRAFT_477956 [Monoraphidium minutum]
MSLLDLTESPVLDVIAVEAVLRSAARAALGCSGTRAAARLAHPLLRAAVDRALKSLALAAAEYDGRCTLTHFPAAQMARQEGTSSSVGAASVAAALAALPRGAWRGVRRAVIDARLQLEHPLQPSDAALECRSLLRELARACPSLEEVSWETHFHRLTDLETLAPAARSLRRLGVRLDGGGAEQLGRLASFRVLRELTMDAPACGVAAGTGAAALASALPALAALSQLDFRLRWQPPQGQVVGPSLDLGPLLAACSGLVDLTLELAYPSGGVAITGAGAALGITRLELDLSNIAVTLAGGAPPPCLPALTRLALGAAASGTRRQLALSALSPRLRALSLPRATAALVCAAGWGALSELCLNADTWGVSQNSYGADPHPGLTLVSFTAVTKLTLGGAGAAKPRNTESCEGVLRPWAASLHDWARPFLPALREFEYAGTGLLPLRAVLPLLAGALGPRLRRLELGRCLVPSRAANAAVVARQFGMFESLEDLTLRIDGLDSEVSWRPMPFMSPDALAALVGPLLTPGAPGAAPRWAPPALQEAEVWLPTELVVAGMGACCERLAAAARPLLRFEFHGSIWPGKWWLPLLDLPETPVLDGIAAALGCGAARAAARLAHPRLCAAVDRTLASLAVGGGYRCRRRGKFPPAQMANLTARFPALERELLLLMQQLARVCPTLEEVQGASEEVWAPHDRLAAMAPAASSLRRLDVGVCCLGGLTAELTPRAAQMLAAFTNVRELTASLASAGDAALLAGALPALAALSRLDLSLINESDRQWLEEQVRPPPLELAPLLLSASSSLVDLRLHVDLTGAPASFKAGAAALGITRLEFYSWSRSLGDAVGGDDGVGGGVLAGLLASAAPTLRSLDLSEQTLCTPFDRLPVHLPVLTELLLAAGTRVPEWRRRGGGGEAGGASGLAGVAPRLRALSVPATDYGSMEMPSAAGCEELTELRVRDVSLINGSSRNMRLPHVDEGAGLTRITKLTMDGCSKDGYESEWGREYHDDMRRTFWSATLLDWASPFLQTLREFEYTCDYPLLLHVALPMLASAAGPTLRRLSLASCVLPWGGAQGAAAGRCFPQFEALEALRLQLLISEGCRPGALAPVAEALAALVGPLLAPGAPGSAPRWAPPALREAVFEVPAGCMGGEVGACCARLAAAAGARPMLQFEPTGNGRSHEENDDYY